MSSSVIMQPVINFEIYGYLKIFPFQLLATSPIILALGLLIAPDGDCNFLVPRRCGFLGRRSILPPSIVALSGRIPLVIFSNYALSVATINFIQLWPGGACHGKVSCALIKCRNTPRIVEDGHQMDVFAVSHMAADLVGSERGRRHLHLRH